MVIGLGGAARRRIAFPREQSGAQLSLDWTVPCLLAAIMLGLRYSILPLHFPAMSATTYWALAFLAAITFFLSVFLHEVSRAVMGMLFGLEVDRVTLFPFTGNTQFRARPRSPSVELATVLVGPATHLALGAFFLSLVLRRPFEEISQLGPVAALYAWIGASNLLLGLLHAIPAFPLDGGRALRAILWSLFRDQTRATRWAAAGGQLTAWAMMGLGVAVAFGLSIPIAGESRFNGLWILAGGWLLNHAAVLSYAEDLVRDTLSHVPVCELMHDEPAAVSRAMSVASFLTSTLLLPKKRTLPVVDGENLLGFVRLEDIASVPQEDWSRTPVGQIMIPLCEIPMLAAHDDADLALQLLVHQRVEQLPVVEHGQVLGFVHRWDIVDWLMNHDVPA